MGAYARRGVHFDIDGGDVMRAAMSGGSKEPDVIDAEYRVVEPAPALPSPTPTPEGDASR